jgi:hypothetical protein
MFFSATDPKLATAAQDVACAFCHFEGRDDGLTWRFEHGPRQTPSLAGPVSEMPPFRWQGEAHERKREFLEKRPVPLSAQKSRLS